MAAGPNRTTRSAYEIGQSLLNTIGGATGLDNTITPEIPFHWVGITLRIKKCLSITQRNDLRAGVTVIDGQDIG